MSAVTHDSELRGPVPIPALRAFLQTAARAIETYGKYRARNAVSAGQWQQADADISRYRRLLRTR